MEVIFYQNMFLLMSVERRFVNRRYRSYSINEMNLR